MAHGSFLFRKLIALSAGMLLVTSAVAQTAYPSKPITLVVGFSAGSSIDLVARVIAEKLSKALGQSVIVENKAGAGGNIAAGYVARAPKDGYTLLVAANSLAISSALYKNIGFDASKDFQAIAYIGISPVDLKVNARLGINSLDELIKYGKANPNKLNYASSGVGGTPHMATVLFEQVTGVKMTHIPYKGGGDALSALMGGQVDILINPILGSANNDKVKTLAITGDQRSSLSPNVPTFKELGYGKYDIGVYYGIVGPAGMPMDAVDKLNASVRSILADPSVVKTLTEQQGVVLKAESPQAFQEYLDKDIQRWKSIVKETGTSLD